MLRTDRELLIQKLLGYYDYPRSYYNKLESPRLLAMALRAENKHIVGKPAVSLEYQESISEPVTPQRITRNGKDYIRLDNGEYVLLKSCDL